MSSGQFSCPYAEFQISVRRLAILSDEFRGLSKSLEAHNRAAPQTTSFHDLSNSLFTNTTTQCHNLVYASNNAIKNYNKVFLDMMSCGTVETGCFHIHYYWYSALGPVWAETRVQSGDWNGSGTPHPGQVLRGSLPLLSPAF